MDCQESLILGRPVCMKFYAQYRWQSKLVASKLVFWISKDQQQKRASERLSFVSLVEDTGLESFYEAVIPQAGPHGD